MKLTSGQALKLFADFREDASVEALTAQQWEDLAEFMATAPKPKAFAAWLADHKIDLSKKNVYRTRDRLKDALAAVNEGAEIMREFSKHGGDVASSLQAGRAVANLVIARQNPDDPESQQLMLNSVNTLTGIATVEVRKHLGERTADQRDTLLAQQERKIKLLEARESKAKAIMGDAQLTPEQKAARMKEVFGIA